VFFPVAGVEVPLVWLLLLGFTVGVCGGFFGFGGGFLVTPALSIFGFPYCFSAGIDLQHIAGKSIVATIRHRELGNVDLRLGVLMIIGTVPGVELGSQVVHHLEKIGVADYMLLLSFIVLSSISAYMHYELFKAKKFAEEKGIREKDVLTTRLPVRVQNLKIPPMVSLKTSKIPHISIWVIIGISFITGLLAGLFGAGGGFVRVPSLIYLIGVPTTIAVGTDLFEVIVSAAYGGFTYAIKGSVEIIAVLLMLVAASFGAQIGTISTAYVRGFSIRHLFSIMILISGISALLRFFASPIIFGIEFLEAIALLLVLSAATILSTIIMVYLIKGVLAEKRK
jgi:hypothetical protein